MKCHTSTISFRQATREDLPEIVKLLSDDVLGSARDGMQHMPAYEAALIDVQSQKGNYIIVAVIGNKTVGVLQLTLIPGLSRAGMLRAQIESVRVCKHHRGNNIGHQLITHAINEAKTAGCGLVQLTSDKQRPDAIRFYEKLGFHASHEGMKLTL